MDSIQDDGLSVSISLERKVNLGNYETAGIFISVNGVKPGTSAEDIDAALDTGKIAYERIRLALKDKVEALREKTSR